MRNRNSRRAFIRIALLAGAGIVSASAKKIQKAVYKRILINTTVPGRIFENTPQARELMLQEVITNADGQKVIFVLSNKMKIQFQYTDNYRKIAGRGLREAMKFKILVSYSLFKICKENKAKITGCDDDRFQRQHFLEELEMGKFAYLVDSL
jgi:hypothetical protein